MADALARNLPSWAHRVRSSETGASQWVEHRDGQELIHDVEPGKGFWRRAADSALSVLPIEWLL